jgi:hypothetical protein
MTYKLMTNLDPKFAACTNNQDIFKRQGININGAETIGLCAINEYSAGQFLAEWCSSCGTQISRLPRSEFLRFGFEAGQDSVLTLPHGPERLIAESRYFKRLHRENSKVRFL